ncbi:MAG: TonB-dependent receptor [Bacteroidota bacterium]|nr:TonB-dependent receptor [Bacteroidota bacterium]
MKRKILSLLSALLLMGVCTVTAQSLSVSGVVTDVSDGNPIPGVSVMVKGSSKGTVTDANGKYVVNTSQGKTLVFKYIGMEKQEVIVQKNVINVQMKTDTRMLSEVVAIGYGTARKSDLSGASTSLTVEKLKGSVITNLDQALQGRVAGVTAVYTSGQPGSSVSIRVRGQNTINSNAEPLYVIDGVPVYVREYSGAEYGLGDALGNGTTSTISPLSTINPADILSMEILKDASATAIYGSRGSNGVVLITTKRGNKGEAKFSYEGLYGVQRQAKRMEVMDLKEFAEYSNEIASETSGRDMRDEFRDPSLLGHGTNWQDAVFQIAPMQSHTVSASGGTEAVRYFVAGSYMDQDGTVIGTTFNRSSFRANLDAQMKKWLKLGMNFSYSKTHERLGLADSDEGIINTALLSTPDVPIYDLEGHYTSVSREGVASRINPIAKALDEDNLLDRNNLLGNIYLDINLMQGLVLHSEYATSLGGSKAERFRPTATYGTWKRTINSDAWQTNSDNYWQLKNYLTYNKEFGLHKATLMLGQETSESSYEYQSITATNLPDNSVHSPQLGTDPVITSGMGSWAMVSAFARGSWNYADKYYATYTFRRDGSSNFGPKNRWAPFHSMAVSWRMSNEDFWGSIKETINDAKLRFGWGQTGNQSIGSYLWGASISNMDTGLGEGYRQSRIANPYIQWETQEQYNLGLDLSVLNKRIDLTLDLYKKMSKDMLMQAQLPSYMGTRGNVSSALAAPYGNYGTIENRGLEISLNTHNFQGNFLWDTEAQLSFNKNKLIALDGTDNAAIEGYGQWSDVVSRTEIGESMYNFYGYVTDGIYQDKEDIENSPAVLADGKYSRTGTVYPGDIKFKDISGPDGKPDGVISEYDRTNIGSPMPKFTFGLNNTFRYKNFDLNVFVNGSYGNKVFNYMSRNLSNMESLWNNQLSVVNRRAKLVAIDETITYPRVNSTGNTIYNWFDDIDNVRVSNSGTNVPRAIQQNPNDNDRISDRYIEDGSYLRIKNIVFGYNVPANMLRKYNIEALRVYTNIQNLLTWTKYSGFDPEIGASPASPNVYGLDNGRYPSPQVYSFGFNLTF